MSTAAHGDPVVAIELGEKAREFPLAKRRRLPETRPSVTSRFEHGGYKGYVTVGFYPDSEQPGEVFVVIAKEGTFVSAALGMVMQEASYLMQHGVPAKWIIEKWRFHVIDPMIDGKSLFDSVADAFERACQQYADCDYERDHLRREVR